MFKALKASLFRAFGDWVIQRAMRTPYFHITHEDGAPYMDRSWLLRVGGSDEIGCEPAKHPWVSARVHHIRSSDWPTPHDHPWPMIILILRGGYDEIVPITRDGVVLARRRYRAGSLRFVRAESWHYLELVDGEDAWTLVLTLPKRQSWGFLVNGVKVPWRQYLAERASKAGA
jgi:hypothetical protein